MMPFETAIVLFIIFVVLIFLTLLYLCLRGNKKMPSSQMRPGRIRTRFTGNRDMYSDDTFPSTSLCYEPSTVFSCHETKGHDTFFAATDYNRDDDNKTCHYTSSHNDHSGGVKDSGDAGVCDSGGGGGDSGGGGCDSGGGGGDSGGGGCDSGGGGGDSGGGGCDSGGGGGDSGGCD